MNGAELAKKIRKIGQTQIVLMTAYDEECIQEDGLAVQALACLTKPLDVDRLKALASCRDDADGKRSTRRKNNV